MLATIIEVITRYWIDYCQIRSEQRQITEQDVQEGIQHVREILISSLTPGGLAMLS